MVTELLTDEQYYYRVLDEIRKTEKEIFVTIFHAKIFSARKDCPVKHIFDSLIQRKTAGIYVSVIFAQHNISFQILHNNKEAMEYLSKNNIQTHFFEQYRLLHTKSILIDRKTAIIGSHNLTKKSLFMSAETSILTTQETVVQKLREYFLHIQIHSKLIW